jgi:hypothetical protein
MRLSCLAALLVAAQPLTAQVGHPPGASPYRDIRYGKSVTLLYGDIGGDGGKLGIGPHDGPAYGARFDIRISAPLQLGVSLAQANLERLIVDADDSVATRVKGPVDQELTMIELALQLNLTGRKTWHRLAPYLTGAAGYASATDTPADTSGYKFGSKFYLAPGFGVRLFVTDRLHLRAEARQLFWKLHYPSSYLDEPADQPGSNPPDDSNAVIQDGKRDQWTGGRELRIGLGFTF